MNAKKYLTAATALLLAALLPCCAGQDPVSAPASQPEQSESASAVPEKPALSQADQERYTGYLNQLCAEGALTSNWSGSPIQGDNQNEQFSAALDAQPGENGIVVVTGEVYGSLYLNTGNMQESKWSEDQLSVPILTEGLPYSPQLALGKATVELRETASGFDPVSCRYEPYPSPGLTYLKEQAAKNPPPADSPRLEVARYNSDMVSYIWRLLLQKRYIASPADLTLAELEAYDGDIEINYMVNTEAYDNPDYRLDAELLRLMPNVTFVNCQFALKDYSVFEGMQKLQNLTLYNMNDEKMSTLRVGHTKRLTLWDPDCDVLDPSGANTNTLSISSWYTAVRGFRGCDKIKNLYMMGTRTDMRLVNAEAFPNADYLNLQFSSDYERVRDFSRLVTFPSSTDIDLMLNDLACNDKTLESLAGVPLRLLVLQPRAGTTPAAGLVEATAANQTITSDGYGYFEERTKASE